MMRIGWPRNARPISLGHAGFVAGFLLVAWWVGAAAHPPAAAAPGPAYQAAEAEFMCPISNEETEQANKTFGNIAAVFTDQPRCVNCHGAVRPFAVGDENSHGGGRQPLFFQAAESIDPATGEVSKSSELDFDATFNQCQDCHSAFPGFWRVPTQDFFFVGKTADQLCLQMHEKLGDPETFLGHIEHDVDPANPFVLEGFKGTRGLNEVGQGAVDGEYQLEPPVGVTHAALLAMARQWIKDTGGEWDANTPECGCRPLNYALRVETAMTAELVAGDAKTVTEIAKKFTLPIKVNSDGTVTGEVSYTSYYTATTTSPGGICVSSGQLPSTWKADGQISGGLFNLTVIDTMAEGTVEVECTVGGQVLASSAPLAGQVHPPHTFELGLAMCCAYTFPFGAPNSIGKTDITIIKVD